MDFEAWTKSAVDPVRRKRLMMGYVVGVATVAALGAFIVLTSNKASAHEEDEPVIEAQLAKEPEPELPPEPVVAPKVNAPKPPPPKPTLKTPVEVPREPLKEAEVDKAQLAEESDPFQRNQQPEEPKPAEPTVVAPPPPPPPKPLPKAENKGPVRVTEDMTPPSAIGAQIKPEFPAEARAQGIEGVVWVKYVVSEAGVVTDAKVVKGPPELSSVCLAAVRAWRFKPALGADGKPTAVVQMARFPFKIKT